MAIRVAARFLEASLPKKACIIAAGNWDKKVSLLKNRDRNYTPDIRIIRKLIDGVEVAYMTDDVTGWCEGLNEHHIGVVNSALSVGRDEAEKKLVSMGKKSKDGERILKALGYDDLDDALKSAKSFKSGIKGHTFISDTKRLFSLEQTSKHECKVSSLDMDELHVYTNHGIQYEDAGYTEGKKYVSSVMRRDQALKALREIEEPEDAPMALMEKSLKKPKDPNNMVRDTKAMSTTSQMVLDLTDLELILYIIPGKSKYLGMDNKLPKGHKPKIKVRVFKYTSNGEKTVELDPDTGKKL